MKSVFNSADNFHLDHGSLFFFFFLFHSSVFLVCRLKSKIIYLCQWVWVSSGKESF